MSSPAYTRWETFASVVGVITAIPLIITLVVMYLPKRKVAGLFAVLNDTDDLLDDLLEEGILGQQHIEIFREHLAHLRKRACKVRDEAHKARDFTEEFKNLLNGLTAKIIRIQKDVTDVRVIIATASSREREEQERAEAARRMAAGSGDITQVSVGYNTAPPIGPATLPPPNICPRPDDTPPHAVQDSEDASRNRTADGSSSSPFSAPSGAPSSRSRKSRSTPCSRTRAFAQFLRHYRRKYATPIRHDDIALITMSELSSIDPLQEDDEDADWEDIASRKVRVLL
ncbi:hypothetical protein VTO73DRAFT_2245 [Trametes versicolor]